jgi:putative FmdB family regulatory protein
MPTYEYTCKNCGANLEIFQKFTDKPLKKCAACGGDLQKVFHARGVVFKGSGFYATDSRGSSASDSSGENGSSKDKSKKTEKKTDSKKAEQKTEPSGAAKSG